MTDSLPLKWLRRYKWYFGLGLLVLCVQLFLANYLPTFGNRSHSGAGSNEPVASLPPASSAATADTAKPYQLREFELSIYPGCDIHTKDAVSAIHRASSQSCKQTIANITCAIQAETFYPARLPNSCPNENFIANRALGCFRDQKSARLLAGYFTNFKQLNTPGKCIQLCLQSGFLYAGVQFASECFCGNTEPAVSAKVADAECDYSCVGEPSQVCGGYLKINVYETGISKFVPQTAAVTSNSSTDQVRIVFLLTVNGRAVRQVHRLLKALYSPKHFYYIHVDSRQDYLYRELLRLESQAPNIRLARTRFSTIWGGASLLTMLLASMNSLLQLSHWHWDFVINLSESDFPVKTVDTLAEFLSANRDRNFVKSHGREVQRFIQKQGLDKTFVECDTHMWRIGDRTLPAGVQIDGGSDWVALSRPFVEYVARDEKDALVDGLLTVFRHTLLPAESFFHTAIRNSHFCNTYVDNNLHVTNWKRKLGCKCQYKHVVDWCGCSPNDFKPDDWPRLLQTEGKQVFFARKFEPVINQAVIFKLEAWLYGHAHLVDVANVQSYWQNVYCHEDNGPMGHESLLLVAERLLNAKLAQLGESIHRILNIYVYMDKDIHRGMLVHANVSLPGVGITELEIWTRHEQLPQTSRSLPVGKRISRLEVSSDFDQKEQVARNFVYILGPKSEPTVVMHLRESTESGTQSTNKTTVLWISPAGLLADVTEIFLEQSTSGESIHFSKSNLKPPIMPGIWTIKVIYQKGVVGKCEFMITPLARDVPTSLTESDLLAQEHADKIRWSKYLSSKDETKRNIAKALSQTDLRDADRLEWIDQLVQRFFVFKGICAISAINATAFAIPGCVDTNWSSMAEDPKSDLFADLQRWVR